MLNFYNCPFLKINLHSRSQNLYNKNSCVCQRHKWEKGQGSVENEFSIWVSVAWRESSAHWEGVMTCPVWGTGLLGKAHAHSFPGDIACICVGRRGCMKFLLWARRHLSQFTSSQRWDNLMNFDLNSSDLFMNFRRNNPIISFNNCRLFSMIFFNSVNSFPGLIRKPRF